MSTTEQARSEFLVVLKVGSIVAYEKINKVIDPLLADSSIDVAFGARHVAGT